MQPPPAAEITPPVAVIVVPSTFTQPLTEDEPSTQEIVPVVVTGPPVKPVPVATLVTVPPVPIQLKELPLFDSLMQCAVESA